MMIFKVIVTMGLSSMLAWVVLSHDRDPANGPSSASFVAGPYQPQLRFPATLQGGKLCSFQATWYSQFPWLEYSPRLDAAFCFSCRLYAASMPGCAEPAFVCNGMKNWRKALGKDGKLTGHAQSNVHKSTWVMWMEAKSQPCSVAARLDTAYQQQVKKNREYMKIIIQTLMFLAKHNSHTRP